MKKKQIVTLSVSHSLFLTEKQRYDLHQGKTIKVIGVSMPVWFFKGSTSEPAEEVFCKYTLNNKKGNAYVQATKNNTYIINLPQVPDDYKEGILSNEQWRKMTGGEKSLWYKSNPIPLSSKKLLNTKDGGCQSLSFQIQHEINVDNTKSNIIHFVLIKKIEELNESLILDGTIL
jgi:hypothetical protein